MNYRLKKGILFMLCSLLTNIVCFSQEEAETDSLSNNAIAREALFPEVLFSSPVFRFIDRYLNHLSALSSQSSRLNLLHEDMVSLKFNGNEARNSNVPINIMLNQITPATTFVIRENEKSFQAQWLINGELGTIEFAFPKQYDLILGKDKKELTEQFASDLQQFASEYNAHIYPLDYDEAAFEEVDVLAELGKSYLIPQMRSGRYIQKREDGYNFVLNERMGEESLLNLFSNADQMNRANRLKLIIKGYHNASDTIDYQLDRLCAYMKAQACKAYLGLETETEYEYTGTVFYVNTELMYKHLFYFRFPKTALQREQDEITIKVYPYIPINNIGDLYEDVTLEINQ